MAKSNKAFRVPVMLLNKVSVNGRLYSQVDIPSAVPLVNLADVKGLCLENLKAVVAESSGHSLGKCCCYREGDTIYADVTGNLKQHVAGYLGFCGTGELEDAFYDHKMIERVCKAKLLAVTVNPVPNAWPDDLGKLSHVCISCGWLRAGFCKLRAALLLWMCQHPKVGFPVMQLIDCPKETFVEFWKSLWRPLQWKLFKAKTKVKRLLWKEKPDAVEAGDESEPEGESEREDRQ